MKSVLAALVASSLIVGCALPELEEDVTASDTGSGGGGGGGTTYQDTTAPAGLNFLIDGGSTTTSRTEVTLELDASDDVEVTEYYASESSEPPTAKTEGWSKFKRNVEFNLKKGGSLGIHPRTVHVWFKDAAGNISESLSASISLGVYDTTAPEAIGVAIDEGAESTRNSTVNLALEATDNDAVSSYFASESDVAPESQIDGWQDYASSVSYTFVDQSPGAKTIYVWFKDAAGNVSGSVTDAIKLRNRVIVSAGGAHACAVAEDQTVQCWGLDNNGQSSGVPGRLKAINVSAGRFHTCVLKTDGFAECWGRSDSGQLSAPENVSFTDITTGQWHSCGIRAEDKEVDCWGAGNHNQTTVPNDLGAVTAISGGALHTCAIKEDQSVVCWGTDDNRYDYGQSDVPDIGAVSSISAGTNHTCAIDTEKNISCWGQDVNQKITVPEGLKANSVSAGREHTCAIKEDQSVVCWGDDTYEQTQVPNGLRAVSISSRRNFTCAVAEDQTVQCWGLNNDGQIDVPENLRPEDTTAPTALGLTIDGGAATTSSTQVTLEFEATDDAGITAYYASESSETPAANADGWADYASSVSYTFVDQSLGAKTIYVWFKDAAGNVSESLKASIDVVADTTAPKAINVTINSGATKSYGNREVTLRIGASDNLGVTSYYASQSSSTPSPSDKNWANFTNTPRPGVTTYLDKTISLSGPSGKKVVYVWVKDAAGNVSNRISDSILLCFKLFGLSWYCGGY